MLVPVVVESTSKGERSFDIYSRLLRDRIVFLSGEVNDSQIQSCIAQMLFLESEDPHKDINLYINSGGGVCTSGVALIDLIGYLNCSTSTVIFGQACSMGSLIASSGTKGKRFMLPNARHMLHAASSGTQGSVIDMKVALNETMRINKLLTEIYAKNTGQPIEKLEQDMSRDFFLTAEESLEYGLIDEIISKRPPIN